MTSETPMNETDPMVPPTETDGSEDAATFAEAEPAGDDMTLAADFMRSLEDEGRLIRFASEKLIWEYDRTRGVWHRMTRGEVMAFEAALHRFVCDGLSARDRRNGGTARVNSVRKVLFRTLSDHYAHPSDFDRSPEGDRHLIAFANGVYDVERDELVPHDPSHMITITRGYDHDPSATCPRFMRFLDEVLVLHLDPADDTSPLVPDPELQILVQEMVGYCFATHCRAERGFLLHGGGRNGKSKLIGVMRQVLGEQNVVDGFDIRQTGDPVMNTMLVGKLAAIGTEVGSGTTVPDGRYKAFISGEGMPMRHLFHDPAPFAPFATLVIACNELPSTNDHSTGFWARTVVIPFLNRFEGEAADTNLQDRFVPELPGIFNWAIEGYRRLRDKGWQFAESAASRAATLQYQEDTDSVLHWFSSSAVVAVPVVKVPTGELFAHYVEHCRRLSLRPDNAILFGKRLKRITAGREGQPWATVADDGTPFSMSFHRDARMRGYVGNFRLVTGR